jgi:hypothetical protein
MLMPLKMSKPLEYLNMTFPQADTHVAQRWPTLLRRCCGSRHYRLAVYHVTALFAADRCE